VKLDCWLAVLALLVPGQERSEPLDSAAVLRELRDFSPAGRNRRLGPDYAFYHKQERGEAFPKIWMPPVKEEVKGRRYEIGGPWSKQAGDFSSTQGQVLYAGDAGVGVDRVTIIEWSNNTFSERPEPPWWGGFRPEPASKQWLEASKGNLGDPVCMARGMGGWANCGIAVFSSGLVATAGTCTGKGSDPTLQLPRSKLPTSISVTNKNEFALVTVVDTAKMKGQLAVLALESSGRKSGFAHEWRDDYPGLPNVAVFTRIKLLGYVDLPGMTFPTSVCAVGTSTTVRLNGPDGNQDMLSHFDLSRPQVRDGFYKGNNADFCSKAGFAVVASRHENKVAFVDLQPLFQNVREMYFTTEENYRKTRNAEQWPPTFEENPGWMPSVVAVVEQPQPTAVLASMSGGPKARAFVASLSGEVRIYKVGGLATEAPAAAAEISVAASVDVGRNPVSLAYQKYSSDKILAVSRGDREIAWIQVSDREAQVIKRLRDARLLDPVHVEVADTHGIETSILTVADFKGRKILNYRYGELHLATQGGARFGMGATGKDEFECGGFLEFPGSPFCVSATNVN